MTEFETKASAFLENFIQNCEQSEIFDAIQIVYFCNWAREIMDKEKTPLPAEKYIAGIRVEVKDDTTK